MREGGEKGLAGLGLIAGLVAAVVLLAVMLIVRVALDVPSLPEMLAEGFTLLLPVSLFSTFLSALGENAKPLLLTGLVLGHLVMGALLGLLYARLWGPSSQYPTRGAAVGDPWAGGLILAAVLWLLALLLVLPASGAGLLGLASREGAVPVALSTLTASLAYGLSLVVFFQGFRTMQASARQEIEPVDKERRALLIRMIAIPVALLAAGGLWQLISRPASSGLPGVGSAAKEAPKGRLPEEITPNNLFYTVSKNFGDPVVNLKEWSLELRASTGQSLTLSYDDLKAFPTIEQVATLTCISNEVGGDLIGNARWTGVRLRDLLSRIGSTGAVDVVLKAWDGYADSIPFDKAMQEGTILAYLMNGEPLPQVHGFPARLVVPGIYGMKNVKWVTGIELVDYDFKGYWQNRGWSDVAVIQIMSRVDMPTTASKLPFAPVDLGGIAFAGDRGISKVEVSGDSGKTWKELTVKEALSPYAWSLWTGQWQPQEPGNLILYVRAWDGQGQVQDKTPRDPLPDGATGYDVVALTLR